MTMEHASFKKSIKRKASAYSALKDECFFDKFQRDLLITAKSHDVSEILDPSYSPGHSPEERELFEARQVFMYKVFNETLQTDMGRTTARNYLRSTDAQAVWKVTEVCYLLEVSWQMCHAWITHWTVARAVLTMSRRRSTRDERTHGRDAREPLLARTRAYLAPREPAFGL